MPFVDLQNYRLHYRQYGSGPPLIFLHGLSFDSRMWVEQLNYFQKSYLSIGLDFRGHGFSDAPDIEYSLETYVSDVTALMNDLHLPSARIVGLSLGGAVAFEFARQYPDRVTALVLVSSALNGHNWSNAWKEVMRRVHSEGTKDSLRSNLRKYWLNDPMFEGVRKKLQYASLLRSMAEQFSGKPILHWSIADETSSAAQDQFEQIDQPVCVFSGEQDRFDFKQIARKMAAQLHRVEWHQIPGAGHMLNLEIPHQFNIIVESFLSKVDAGGI